MKRVLCLWFPNWPIQRLRSTQPELEHRLLVLYRPSGRRGAEVVTCTRAAARAGVTIGMPLAEAQGVFLIGPSQRKRGGGDPEPAPLFLASDPQTDRQALKSWANFCRRFTPLAAVEDTDTPESLFLEIAGCGHLFGGEYALAEEVAREFQQRGFAVRVAVADTAGAAWAAAHFGGVAKRRPVAEGHSEHFHNRPVILAAGEQTSALAPLPIESLRLPVNVVQTLHEFDIRRVGQLQALPRAALPSRFGPLVLQRLDQALGHAPEVLVPERPPEPIKAIWPFDFPTQDRQTIETVLRQLLDQVIEQLAPRQEGILQLACRFELAGKEPLSWEIGLLHPSASPGHLIELLRMRLEQTAFDGEVTSVGLRTVATAPLTTHQAELFPTGPQSGLAKPLALLVQRLSTRLGRQRVVRPCLQPDVQPERAVNYVPLVDGAANDSGGSRRMHWTVPPEFQPMPSHACGVRPLRLLRQPIPIYVWAFIPDGPPLRFAWSEEGHLIARSWGPERLETGWWRQSLVRRDYYRVETIEGRRFWLYRRIDEGDWFLHGEFE